MLRKILKITGWTLAGIFGLIVLILIAIQTPPVKAFLRDRVISITNEFLYARLSIGRIEGNFFTNLTVRDGVLAFGDTTAVSFESLELHYAPLAILSDRVHVESIRLNKPRIFVFQDSGGVLNLARMAKPTEPTPVDSAAEPLGGFTIELDELLISDGLVDVATPGFKGGIKDLNVGLRLNATPKLQSVALERFHFLLTRETTTKQDETKIDSLRIHNITLIANAHALPRSFHYREKHPDRVDSLWADLKEFRIVTDRTDFFVGGRFVLPDSAHGIALHYETDVRAYPFHLEDARAMAPLGMHAIQKIEMEAHVEGDDRKAELNRLNIITGGGSLKGWASVGFGQEPLTYKTQLSFSGINAAAFSDNPDFYTNINGNFSAEGAGIKPENLTSQLAINLQRSRAYGVDMERFSIQADVREGTAKLTKFEGVTNAGTFNCEGSYNLVNETYHLETKLDRINIGDVIGDTSLQSSINLRLAYDGKGLNPKTMQSKVSIISDSSKVLGRDLENLTFLATKEGKQIRLDKVQLRTPLANISAQGTVGLDSTVNLKYSLETVDFSLLKKYIGNDSLLKDTVNLKLKYNGSLRGNMFRMTTSGYLTLTDVVFGPMRVDSLQFTYFADNLSPAQLQRSVVFKREDTTIVGDLFFYTHQIRMPGALIRDFTTSITKEKGRTLFEISGAEDTVSAFASIKGSLMLENEKRGQLYFDELFMRIAGRTLRTREVTQRLGEDPIIDSTYERWLESWKNSQPIDLFFDTEKNIYDFRSFAMDIGKGSIAVSGQIDIAGDQNLDVKIKDLDLSRANTLLGSKQSVVEGLFNLNASLKGTFEKPIMTADWSISKGKASEFVYENFLGNMQYLNRKVQLNMTLNQNSEKTMTVGGYLPIDLSFKDVKERFTARPINFKIHSEGIDLRFLQAFFGRALRLNRGDLKVDMTISGNKEKPKLEGELKIEGGQISFPKTTLGQSFRNISMFVRLTPEKIFLDTLYVQSGKDAKSTLFTYGTMDLADVLKDFKFNNYEKISYEVRSHFNSFVPINTKSETSYLHTAAISGDMIISAPSLFQTQIKGDLQIKNSEIWVVDPKKAKLSSGGGGSSKKGEAKPENDFYKNLDLDLTIDLPENSENAIRSAEMLLTLYGNIGVTKPPLSEEFFISGDVKTRPGGKYAYLSIAFNIVKGDITFTGEPGVNPQLDIEAAKRFEYKDSDGQSIPAEAKIQVTGRLLKPEVAITAVERGSDSPLPDLAEPADILSYLVLGVKTKDLTKVDASQAQNIMQQTAINQILNMVANKAGLSKLEYIPSTTDASKATIEVGKRINENVSVNFSGGTDPSVGRSITLEMVIDSAWGLKHMLRTWKKTLEFEYKQPPQEKADQPDVFNLLFFFRKEY